MMFFSVMIRTGVGNAMRYEALCLLFWSSIGQVSSVKGLRDNWKMYLIVYKATAYAQLKLAPLLIIPMERPQKYD